MGSARPQRITGKGETVAAGTGAAAKPRRRRLPATAPVGRPAASSGNCQPTVGFPPCPVGGRLEALHAKGWRPRGHHAVPARRPATGKAIIVCRGAGPGAPFCRHDAQRPGGARMLDGHAAHGCRYAGCQKAADERRYLRREKISRPSAWDNMLDDLSGKTKALTGLSGVASGRFGSIAPRYRAHADEPIAHASAFGFGIEAGGTDRPPAVQHDRAPGVLGLDLETDHVASPAFITNGRDHPPGVKAPAADPTNTSPGLP
jgi:hypothetical protein